MNKKILHLVKFGSKFIDYKMGICGAIVMGGIVFVINYRNQDGFGGALTASLKQAAYTFLLGGVFMKGSEFLATRIKNYVLAIVLAIIIPSVITILLTYKVHTMKGTPEPLHSTIPTLIIIPATAIWAYKKRKQFVLEKDLG